MDNPPGDSVRFSGADSRGRSWTHADLDRATLSWHTGGGEEHPITAEAVAQLRALAAEVRPEQAELQSTHITYGCEETLEVRLGDQRCLIDIFGGVIDVGPPHAVVAYLLSLRRAIEAPAPSSPRD